MKRSKHFASGARRPKALSSFQSLKLLHKQETSKRERAERKVRQLTAQLEYVRQERDKEQGQRIEAENALNVAKEGVQDTVARQVQARLARLGIGSSPFCGEGFEIDESRL